MDASRSRLVSGVSFPRCKASFQVAQGLQKREKLPSCFSSVFLLNFQGMWEAGEALQVLRGLSSPVDIRTQLLRAIKTIDELVARFFSGA